MYLLIVVMVVWYGNGTTSELLVKEFVPGKEACEQLRDNIVKSYDERRVSQGTQVDARCILVEGE